MEGATDVVPIVNEVRVQLKLLNYSPRGLDEVPANDK